MRTNSDVLGAGSVANERSITHGRVVRAGRVTQECLRTGGRVEAAGRIALERLETKRGIVCACGVTLESLRAQTHVARWRRCHCAGEPKTGEREQRECRIINNRFHFYLLFPFMVLLRKPVAERGFRKKFCGCANEPFDRGFP